MNKYLFLLSVIFIMGVIFGFVIGRLPYYFSGRAVLDLESNYSYTSAVCFEKKCADIRFYCYGIG